jgi:hypothetical protein
MNDPKGCLEAISDSKHMSTVVSAFIDAVTLQGDQGQYISSTAVKQLPIWRYLPALGDIFPRSQHCFDTGSKARAAMPWQVFGLRMSKLSIKIREPVESFTWKSDAEKRSRNLAIGLRYSAIPLFVHMLVLSWFLDFPSLSGEVGRSGAFIGVLHTTVNTGLAGSEQHAPGRRQTVFSQ